MRKEIADMPLFDNKEVNKLMDESNVKFENGQYEESIRKLIEAWNTLPESKYIYDESFLIVWGILDIAILIHNEEVMKKWVNHIFLADPERVDSGEREMWAGKVYYELKEYKKAYEYFCIAKHKSKGRCFFGKNEKYKKFMEKN